MRMAVMVSTKEQTHSYDSLAIVGSKQTGQSKPKHLNHDGVSQGTSQIELDQNEPKKTDNVYMAIYDRSHEC